ncbi:O-methyltransferase [Afifella sp. IM 167]|uniref:O-methyltransferase n=1 Tax=Afifella sp. IM 167 TaxID=2033586 RepID=UPI001CCDC801|nr:class I SAM-dependent methyltransferase [Afifella sp. IM 167]MBZ8133730.1 methyltransferase [Afifella sp. IM 167]
MSRSPASLQEPDFFSKWLHLARRFAQPRYWPELGRRISAKLSPREDSAKQGREAVAVCSERAIGIEELFSRLGLPQDAIRDFAAEHPQRVSGARERISGVKGHMGGPADQDLLYSLCRATGAERVLETGVAWGWSSLAILSAISERPSARLVSIDLPYLEMGMDKYVGLAVPQELRRFWSLRSGADRDELPGALADFAPLDLAHYDSDKSYDGRMFAYPRIWEALKPGGLLVSDDLHNNLAFIDFAQSVGVEPFVLAKKNARADFVGVARKPA